MPSCLLAYVFLAKRQVQLNTNKTVSLPLPNPLPDSPASIANAAFKLISATERAFQTDLHEAYSDLSERTFKELRRGLPRTKSKIDWNRVSRAFPPLSTRIAGSFLTSIWWNSWEVTSWEASWLVRLRDVMDIVTKEPVRRAHDFRYSSDAKESMSLHNERRLLSPISCLRRRRKMSLHI